MRYACAGMDVKRVTNGGFTNLKAVGLGGRYLCRCSKCWKAKRNRNRKEMHKVKGKIQEKENERET